jgi:hypothetical protein
LFVQHFAISQIYIYFSLIEIKLNEMEMEQIDNWEFQAAETYAFQKLATTSDQLDERVKALGDR